MTRRWCWIPVLLLLGVVVSRAQTTESPGTSWDRRYDRPMYVYGKEPVDFLRQIVGRLRPGAALVLAAGEATPEAEIEMARQCKERGALIVMAWAPRRRRQELL